MIAQNVARLASGALGFYVFLLPLLAAFIAVRQEQKLWKQAASLPAMPLFGMLRVYWMNVVWMIGCSFGAVFVVLKHVVSFGRSDVPLDSNRLVEDWIARTVVRLFIGKVQIKGAENLPAEDAVPAPIYIANHASQIDVFVVILINRRYKFIAKNALLYMPGVGQIAYLSKHILINRQSGKNKKSNTNLFAKSDAAVQSGIPMFFFPQGTRRMSNRLPFKDGAFILAQTNKSPLVPISIEIPVDAWTTMYPISLLWTSKAPTVTLTVHPVVTVTGQEDRQALKQQCFDTIYSVVPAVEDEDPKHK
jgi:1-acyl-sn-glycerol-3-phosphate acyltransferase